MNLFEIATSLSDYEVAFLIVLLTLSAPLNLFLFGRLCFEMRVAKRNDEIVDKFFSRAEKLNAKKK